MLGLGARAIGKYFQRHRFVLVHQRGPRRHACVAGHAFRDGREWKIAQTIGLDTATDARGERIARALAEAFAQCIQIARFRQHLGDCSAPIGLAEPQVHAQMRLQRSLVEVDRRHWHAGGLR